jgi:hypothetical protein
LLHIPDGKYYRSGGQNFYNIKKLERLLEILSEIRGEESDWLKTSSSDYLVTVAEVHSNLFLTLKYTAQVIGGFNLTNLAMNDLDELIKNYDLICSMQNDISHFWDVLKSNSESASEKGIEDVTILNPDINGLQKILTGYGNEQYAKVTKAIQDWYEAYRWKYKSTSNANAHASKEDGMTETVEAT